MTALLQLNPREETRQIRGHVLAFDRARQGAGNVRGVFAEHFELAAEFVRQDRAVELSVREIDNHYRLFHAA